MPEFNIKISKIKIKNPIKISDKITRNVSDDY